MDTTIALYSGSMGAKQGIGQLIEAARLLTGRPEIQFVICGDGVELPGLRAMATGLPNVRFLPLQDSAQLNDLLNLADVHVLPQKASVADLVMPSKLIGMLASGRPVVATAQEGSEVAAVVSECGTVVPPESPAALASAIVALSENEPERKRLGIRARAYAAQNFRREAILEAFELRLLCSTGV
jgi:colanic acid biosynthesis glycosyl transferase WcaI